jgi:phage-related protein
MPSFPTLKTGAVAQYPSDRATQFSTQVYRFLDGSEQRFPAYGAALHRWAIRLDLLDEGELETIEEFFTSEAGRSGSFSFTDPWDGTVYPSCSFERDTLALAFRGPQRGATQIVIKENR